MNRFNYNFDIFFVIYDFLKTRNLEQINSESEKADYKRKKMLSEIISTSKRLQNTVEHSLVLLKQVQRDFDGQNRVHRNIAAKLSFKTTQDEEKPQEIEEKNTNGKNEERRDEEEEKEDLEDEEEYKVGLDLKIIKNIILLF